MIPRRVVGQISVNWPGDGRSVGDQFESLIAANNLNGFELESWQLSRAYNKTRDGARMLNETIVAVFVERMERTEQ